MVIILGDILADYAIRVAKLEIQPKDLLPVSYLALGPGGACNVAIMASHLGLSVSTLGEVGRDLFGEIVLEGLAAEGVARRCGCSKALIIQRLGQLRRKLGRHPAELRAFASQFEAIEKSVGEFRGRRLSRQSMLYGD